MARDPKPCTDTGHYQFIRTGRNPRSQDSLTRTINSSTYRCHREFGPPYFSVRRTEIPRELGPPPPPPPPPPPDQNPWMHKTTELSRTQFPRELGPPRTEIPGCSYLFIRLSSCTRRIALLEDMHQSTGDWLSMNAMYPPVVGIREEIISYLKAGLLQAMQVCAYICTPSMHGYPVLYAEFPRLYLSLPLLIIRSYKQTFS